jgi:hypothetical protein
MTAEGTVGAPTCLQEKENPDLQGKDSNLCCQVKSTQNCLKVRQFERLLAHIFSLQFLVLFARLSVWLITVTDLFLWKLGILIRKIRIGFKSFF